MTHVFSQVLAFKSLSLAGHWKLNNLRIMFDNDSVTCDGTVDVTSNEDINSKMRATGFKVVDVYNGDTNVVFEFRSPSYLTLCDLIVHISRSKRPY